MSSKSLVMLGLVVGSTVGSYIPVLFGASFLSFTSLLGSTIGGILGVIIAYRFSSEL